MKLISIVIIGLLIAGYASAYDPRSEAAGTPFNVPDPSLKTTDRFVANLGPCQYIGEVEPGYQLPGIFGGPLPVAEEPEPAWMDLTEHAKKLNATNQSITAASSYDLTAWQMRDVPLGAEQWL
jgi:hypothetical protein